MTAAFYVAGEGEKDDTEEPLTFILEEGGIDLQARTVDRVVCKNRNRNLKLHTDHS